MKTKAILLLTTAAFLLTLAPAVTNAQFIKGSMLAEGGLGSLTVFNNTSEYSDAASGIVGYKYKNNGFSVGIFPRIGFFLSKNMVVGTTLGVNFYSNKSKNVDPISGITVTESKYSAATLDLMPFVRYYFGKSVTTRFYGQVGGGVSLDLSRKDESKNLFNGNSSKTNYTKKPNTISGEALVGVNHFVSQNVAINAGLGYRFNSSKETVTSTYTSGGTSNTSDPEKYTNKGGAFSWNVGFTMFIPCGKKGKK